MAKQFPSISTEQQAFIAKQPIFFVGTAAATGRVNISPKGMDSFRVLDANRVIWLNLTGSGNETAAHLLQNDRMTIMFCAFEGKPLILRLYGYAEIYHKGETAYEALIDHFPETAGARQIISIKVDMVQTSCGFAVPFMDFKEERTQLKSWAQKQGPDKIKDYWKAKNTRSIDDFPTGMTEE
ncbi:MAG: pyridoxamine 5'-phosphate oxidase family protein [Saprospiraceae bacterium]